jgi:hypothetical protein
MVWEKSDPIRLHPEVSKPSGLPIPMFRDVRLSFAKVGNIMRPIIFLDNMSKSNYD